MHNTSAIRGVTHWRLIAVLALLPGLLLLPRHATAQTLQRLQSAGALNIGFISDQPPFSSISQGQEPVGFAIELCRTVASTIKARKGLPTLKVNFVPTSAIEGVEKVENGELDLLCGAVSETLAAREHVAFSIPIYIGGVGAIVRKDASPSLLRALTGTVPHTGPTWRATVNAGLSNQTYAVHGETTSEAFVRERIAQSGVIAKIVSVRSNEEGIDLVAKGKASAFFSDRIVLGSLAAVRKDGDELMVLDRRFSLEPVALALQKGDEEFRLLVDTALSEIYRSGGYLPAYTKSFGEPTELARTLYQASALPR